MEALLAPLGLLFWGTPVFIFFWGRKLRREGRVLKGQVGAALTIWSALVVLALVLALLCSGGHGCRGMIEWIEWAVIVAAYVLIAKLLKSAASAPFAARDDAPSAQQK